MRCVYKYICTLSLLLFLAMSSMLRMLFTMMGHMDTMETLILRCLDNMDSRLNTVNSCLELLQSTIDSMFDEASHDIDSQFDDLISPLNEYYNINDHWKNNLRNTFRKNYTCDWMTHLHCHITRYAYVIFYVNVLLCFSYI